MTLGRVVLSVSRMWSSMPNWTGVHPGRGLPAEHEALMALAHTMAEAPQTILQHLADTALRLPGRYRGH